MNLLINCQKQMNLVKNANKNYYINQASAATNVGLMVYEHKGLNDITDKAFSCTNPEIIEKIGQVNSQNTNQILNPIKSTGWTLIEKVINESLITFIRKKGQNNENIILIDGEKTCDSNPLAAAKNLKNSFYAFSINVISFDEAYNKVNQYIQKEKKKYFDKSISITKYQLLSDLSNKIFKKLINFKNDTLKNINNQLKISMIKF